MWERQKDRHTLSGVYRVSLATKKDIIRKYMKLTGKLWREWYNVKEKEMSDGMVEGDGEESIDGAMMGKKGERGQSRGGSRG